MAINVYLTVFRRFTAERLKRLEWIYLLVCYGSTLIVALVCLFVSTPSRGKVYGPNIVWCSIGIQWAYLRIVVVYGPAWVCIVSSLCLYTISGIELFKKRNELLRHRSSRDPSYYYRSLFSPDALATDIKTTQIHVVSEPITSLFKASNSRNDVQPGLTESKLFNHCSPTERKYHSHVVTTISSTPPPPASHNSQPVSAVRPFLQRFHSSSASTRSDLPNFHPRASAATADSSRATAPASAATLAYAKVALLFFFCLLVTWVPASVNRVYTFVHPHQINVPSSYATSIVLPLMGFWNSVIYVVTSWNAVRALVGGASVRMADSWNSMSGAWSWKKPAGSSGSSGHGDNESSSDTESGRPLLLKHLDRR